MGRMPKWVCLWPGLPQLWMRGAWSGLALAVGFTALVNVLLMASLVWTAWFSPAVLLLGWAGVALLFGASALVSLGWLGAGGSEATENDGEELFREAQTHYLKGNWFEAETLLNQRISRASRDVDAQLMLATLQRHTGRLDEALLQLEKLERHEWALKWYQEIARERQLIARARAEQQAETPRPASPETLPGDSAAPEQALHEAA